MDKFVLLTTKPWKKMMEGRRKKDEKKEEEEEEEKVGSWVQINWNQGVEKCRFFFLFHVYRYSICIPYSCSTLRGKKEYQI